MPDSPSASITVESSVVIVRAHGEFDFASSRALSKALTEAVRSGMSVVVDVSDVSFIDAACLGQIARAHERVTAAGAELRVVGAHGLVRRVFELTDLATVLRDS